MEYEVLQKIVRGAYGVVWKEDERHGYGEMYWTDGSVYKGEWNNGKQHGCREV